MQRKIQTWSFSASQCWQWVLMLCAGINAATLFTLYQSGYWLVNKQGQATATDYLPVYATGLLVWQGKAVQAYHWVILHAMQLQVMPTVDGFLGWHYPPIHFFVAMLTILLPYGQSLAAWLILSGVLCIVALRGLMGWRWAVLLTLGFPVALMNVRFGQNGFYTAALLAGCLLAWQQHRPKRAGVWLGWLAYKPQYGVLFPLILLVEKQWRLMLWATLTVVALVALSAWAFGIEAWQQFFLWLPETNKVVLGRGVVGLRKLQSVEAWLRLHGWPLDWAMVAHGLWLAMLLGWVLWVRKKTRSANIGAAALALAAILSSPYVYIYDVMAAVVAFGFVLRALLREQGRAYEHAVLLLVFAMLYWQMFMGGQMALGAMLVLGGLISWRTYAASASGAKVSS